jgi:tetratricopeptide (TPR) repeat protein
VNLLRKQGRLEQAEELARAVLKRAEVRQDDEQGVLEALHGLAEVINDRRRFAESEALYRRAIELSRPDGFGRTNRLELRRALAKQFLQAERFADAAKEYQRALEEGIEAYGPDDPKLVRVRYGLAEALWSRGRARQAVEQAEEAWRRANAGGVGTIDRGLATFALARALWARGAKGDRARATELAHEALSTLEGHERTAEGAVSNRVRQWIDEHSERR